MGRRGMPRVKAGALRDGAQRELVCVRGRLEYETVRRGTGSEHDSWVVVSKDFGTLLLKRLGANPFERDALPAEPGCEIEAEGYPRGGEFRYVSLRKLGATGG